MLLSFIRSLTKNKLFKHQELVRKEASNRLFSVSVISYLISITTGSWLTATAFPSKSLEANNLKQENKSLQAKGEKVKISTIQAFLPYPIANKSRLKDRKSVV